MTGSAHGVLAPYWAERLGRTGPMQALQCSPRRGELVVTVQEEHVLVAGRACLFLQGTLRL